MANNRELSQFASFVEVGISSIGFTTSVGIGKTNPQFNLDVAGDINFTGTFYQGGTQFIASRWSATGSDIYRLSKVGINTSIVSSALTVNGDVYVSGVVTATTFIGAVTGTASSTTNIPNLSGDITSVNSVTSIAAGVIVDADINASAAIVDTKLATISTALKVSNSATTATNANTASAIVARDASGNFSAGTITAALTGTASSTTNIPNLSGAITSNNTTTSLGSFSSANLATALTDETGSGAAVFATSPTLVTPSLGAASATSINSSGIVTATQFVTGTSGSAIGINTNTISGPATITIDPAAVGDNTGLVVIKGDLQIDGTTTTINSTTVTVDDKNIILGSGAINDAAADGSGITIESGNGNKTFQFEDTGDNLGSSENLNVASGKVYKVNNTSVLSSTTLGSGVVNSSLTSVGTLGQLQVTGVSTFTNGPILVGTATSTGTASQRLQVDGGAYVSGNLGIGTTNPSLKLTIAGSLGIDEVGSGGSRTLLSSSGSGFVLNHNDNSPIIFQTLGANRFRWDHNSSSLLINSTTSTGTASQPLQVTGGAYVSGNIGVGTTNPTAKLSIGSVSGFQDTITTVATTAVTTIDSFATATFRSTRVQVQITQSTNYQASDVLIIHDGTNASIVEYGSIATNDYLGTFSASVSDGNCLLRINMSSATSATVKVLSQRITV